MMGTNCSFSEGQRAQEQGRKECVCDEGKQCFNEHKLKTALLNQA